MAVLVSVLQKPVEFFSVGRFVSGPGWRHAKRTLDSHEFVLVRKGVLPLRVGERRMFISSGQLALLPRNLEHEGTENISSDLEFYWMHFRMRSQKRDELGACETTTSDFETYDADRLLSKESRALLLPTHASAVDADRLVVLLTQLVDVYAALGPQSNAYCDYLATCVLLEVSMQQRNRGVSDGKQPGFAALQQVHAWIYAHAYDDITVSSIAHEFHYSPSYLTSLYKQAYGIGIAEQITEYRVDRARELLSSTTSSVQEIAYEVGFDDPKYFMRVFKRRTGLTASQYRKAFSARLFNTV